MSQPVEVAEEGDSQETNYFDWQPSCDDAASQMMPVWQPPDIQNVSATAGPLSVADVKKLEVDEAATADPLSSPLKKRKLITRGSDPVDPKYTSVTTFQDQNSIKFPILPLAIQDEKSSWKTWSLEQQRAVPGLFKDVSGESTWSQGWATEQPNLLSLAACRWIRALPECRQRKLKHFITKGSGKDDVCLGETFAGLGGLPFAFNSCLQAGASVLGVAQEDLRSVTTQFVVEHHPARLSRLTAMHKDLTRRPQIFKDPLSSLTAHFCVYVCACVYSFRTA